MNFDVSSNKAIARGADRYVVGQVERFDQKNEMFKRPLWDPSQRHILENFYAKEVMPKEKSGYRLEDQAIRNGAWYLEHFYAMGIGGGRVGMLAWDSKLYGETRPPRELKLEVNDPAKVTRMVKKAATFYGASMVGVCEVDIRWVYSNTYFTFPHPRRNDPIEPIEIPEEYKYAVVLVVAMNYGAIQTSPALPGAAAVGLGYSKEAFEAGLVAQFIRCLGYKALPMGNDTAQSIPLAINAGLGELGRHGILITQKFGPRVRVSKVFTNLPLVPDEPIEFGVWDFCQKCGKCARHCPGQAIKHGEPTTEINNISNREGLYRWPINAEKCLGFWASNGGSCVNCVRVCPFNKPPGLLHDSIRWGIRNFRWMDPLFIWGDDLFGYGKKMSAERFWNS
jgi:epoxyqueuosine reductase